MSNPFGDPDDEDNGGEILEGFLCPICRNDLKSLEFLAQHFEREHSEEQDALKSIFKDIFTKAKNKIKQNFDDSFERNFDKNLSISGGGGAGGASGGAGQSAGGSNGGSGGGVVRSNARSRMNVFNFMDRQEMGAERSHLEYFQSVRNPRLERYASETNKLIIRLHRLLKDMPMDAGLRKQHERNTVAWLDGSSVKLCPSCAKSFHLARRQHHCRLCGSIMCNDCSQFLPFDTGYELASLTLSQAAEAKANSRAEKNSDANSPQQNTLRICSHCLWLLETRQQMHESRTSRPPITQLYSDIQQLRKDVIPDIDMYLKIIQSLYEGESIFTIGDASALRGKIGHFAELIDVRSKRVLALPCQEGSREESLKKAVRLSCIQMIKEKIMSLPPLPDEEEIRKVQERKRMEAEQRIATERRQAMEAYERYGLGQNENSPVGGSSGRSGVSTAGTYAQGSDLQSLDHWSAHQVSSGISGSDDPLVEQINIIKGYIKQARQEMNFDVVMTLELNLRELQREFYERQRNSTMPTTNSADGGE